MVAKENPFFTYCGVSFLRMTSFTFITFNSRHKQKSKKHREAAKMRKQRNMIQMKEQKKTPEKTKQDGYKQSMRCRVRNIGYQDAQGI